MHSYLSVRHFLFTMALLAITGFAYAQTTVSGTVTDAEEGSAIPGVNVLVKGTSTGTITDVEGQYSVTVSGEDPTLVFSSVGYATQEVEVGSQSTVDVNMAPDIQSLAEIVVTGYSTEDRRDVTGAVATVEAEQLQAVPSGNVEQQLQGRVSGVTVITNGQPGTSSVVRVRGFGSLTNNEPLYVVDGVPVDNTQFLQPDDIESTTVLKDAASASIYGARAASGVIVYTTKRGARGEGMKVSYDGVFGVTVPAKVNNILSPLEEAQWTWQAERNTAFQLDRDPTFNHPQYGTGPQPILPDYINVGGASGIIGGIDLAAEAEKYNINPTNGNIYQVVRANQAGTNWWDAITQVAPLNRHTLGFTGGTERSVYYVSLGIQDQEGILLNQRLQRYSFRVNSEHDLLDRLRVGENVQLTYYSAQGLTGDNGGRGAADDENDFLQAFRMPAIIPVYDEFGGYAGTAARGFNNPRNPVANRERIADNTGYALQTFGNVYAELDVIDGLTLRSSFGGGFSNSYYNFYNPLQYENSENRSSFGYGEGASTGYNWVFTNTARYERTFGRHNVSVLGGVESLNTGTGRGINGSGLNPFTTDPNYVTLSNTQAEGRQVGSGYGLGVNFFSVFGSAKYIFNDKYIINGIVRRDGSSRFGAETRYGIFPAVSAAWRISDEAFMDGLTFISDLKLRGGWGQMGNSSSVDPNNQFSLFASSLGRSAYDIGGINNGVAEGFYRNRIGNPNARWETSITSNVGFDGSFLDGKLDLVVDVWRKDTEDLLYTLDVPDVVGPLASAPAINIAKMRNEGIDIELITRGTVASEVNFEARFTTSFLRNEIVSLAPGVDYFDAGGSRIGPLIRNRVGQPLSSFFGYKVLGLFQDQAEIDAAPDQDGVTKTAEATDDNPAGGVGRFRYEDINGDGEINVDDRTYLGDPIPNFTGGLNLKVTYRNWELETFVAVFAGFENYFFGKWFTDFYPSFTGAAKGQRVKDSFIPEELGGSGGNTVPIYENVSNFSTNTQSNSYYVENGNYARMTNLQIGYNLPQNLLDKVGIERARIYVQGINLFTITNYQGLEPGVGGGADTTLGVDIGNPPTSRGYNVGVKLGF